MAIVDYSSLQASIASWLLRDDLTAQIPDFITFAEASIARDLRHPYQEKRIEADLDERYEALPNDFLEMRRLHISGGKQLRLMSGDQMAGERDDAENTAGEPRYYTITANNIEFYPTPDQTYTMTMLYYARIDALSDSITTNWLLQRHPDIYLYGALIHAAPFLHDDERLAVWTGLYNKAVSALNDAGREFTTGGGALVLKPRR